MSRKCLLIAALSLPLSQAMAAPREAPRPQLMAGPVAFETEQFPSRSLTRGRHRAAFDVLEQQRSASLLPRQNFALLC